MWAGGKCHHLAVACHLSIRMLGTHGIAPARPRLTGHAERAEGRSPEASRAGLAANRAAARPIGRQTERQLGRLPACPNRQAEIWAAGGGKNEEAGGLKHRHARW